MNKLNNIYANVSIKNTSSSHKQRSDSRDTSEQNRSNLINQSKPYTMGKHSSNKEQPNKPIPASFTDEFDFCISPILLNKTTSTTFDTTNNQPHVNKFLNNFLPENEDQDMDIDQKDWLEGEPIIKLSSPEIVSKGSK
jgi:hypothetical protein